MQKTRKFFLLINFFEKLHIFNFFTLISHKRLRSYRRGAHKAKLKYTFLTLLINIKINFLHKKSRSNFERLFCFLMFIFYFAKKLFHAADC